MDGERAEQQRRAATAGLDVPQPDGADDSASLDGNEGEPLGRLAALTQTTGRLAVADRAIGDVEQRLAGALIDGPFGSDREGHARVLPAAGARVRARKLRSG